jgi:hypothetical protein
LFSLDREACVTKRRITFLVLALAVLLVGFVWAELASRWMLFYTQEHAELYANHVDETYFVTIPRVAHVGAAVALVALVLAMLSRRIPLTILSAIVAAAGFVAPRVLIYLHEHHVLVTYSEFTQHFFKTSE